MNPINHCGLCGLERDYVEGARTRGSKLECTLGLHPIPLLTDPQLASIACLAVSLKGCTSARARPARVRPTVLKSYRQTATILPITARIGKMRIQTARFIWRERLGQEWAVWTA